MTQLMAEGDITTLTREKAARALARLSLQLQVLVPGSPGHQRTRKVYMSATLVLLDATRKEIEVKLKFGAFMRQAG